MNKKEKEKVVSLTSKLVEVKLGILMLPFRGKRCSRFKVHINGMFVLMSYCLEGRNRFTKLLWKKKIYALESRILRWRFLNWVS